MKNMMGSCMFSSAVVVLAIANVGAAAESLWPVDESQNPIPLPSPLSTVGCEWRNVTVPGVSPPGRVMSTAASTTEGLLHGRTSTVEHYAIADGWYSSTGKNVSELRKPLRKGDLVPTGVTAYVAILCGTTEEDQNEALDDGEVFSTSSSIPLAMLQEHVESSGDDWGKGDAWCGPGRVEDRACVYENLWHVPPALSFSAGARVLGISSTSNMEEKDQEAEARSITTSSLRDWVLLDNVKELKREDLSAKDKNKEKVDDNDDVLMSTTLFASETNSHAQWAGRWTVRPQRIAEKSVLKEVVAGFSLPPLVVRDEVLLVSRSDASGSAHFLYDTVVPAVAAGAGAASLHDTSASSAGQAEGPPAAGEVDSSTSRSVLTEVSNTRGPKVVFVDDCSLTGRGPTIEFRQQNAPAPATSGETWFANSLRSYPATCAIITRQWSDAVFGEGQWTSLSALTQNHRRAVLFRRAASGGMQVFSPWQKDHPYRRPGLMRPLFAQIQERLAAFAAGDRRVGLGENKGKCEKNEVQPLGEKREVDAENNCAKDHKSQELYKDQVAKKKKYYVTIAVKKSSGRRTISNRDAVVAAVRELVRQIAAEVDSPLSPSAQELEVVELDVSTPTHLKHQLHKEEQPLAVSAAAVLKQDIQILQKTKLLIANAGTLQDVYAFLLPEKTALYVLPMCVGVRQGCVSETFFFAGLSPTIARREHFVDVQELLQKAMEREDHIAKTLQQVESTSREGADIVDEDEAAAWMFYPTLSEMLSTAGFNFPVDVPKLVNDVRDLLVTTLSKRTTSSGLVPSSDSAAKTQSWAADFLDDPFIRLST
ncbi:unnamed protein product [Amoebophrya sp. A120]|nr:unnamed protein product [Amoebophrya sp. A120]|eukprot:GSA120T00025743001.1